jgi:TonB family protein
MREFYEILQQFGASTADTLWFPILIWTTVASLIFFILRFIRSINPLYQYHIRVATLFALPIGLVSAVLLQLINTSYSSATFNTSLFTVENPLPQVSSSSIDTFDTIQTSINWIDLNFLIGSVSLVFILVACFFSIKLLLSYYHLKKLHSNLKSEPLTNIKFKNGLEDGSVSIAFNDHPLVPFTFGWNKPIIVIPEKIKNDPQKLNMAIQHELVHIRRGDYLLQLVISLIRSIFWFHPLIIIGSKEIETYREISCDQEVLNTSDIHPKKYANLLLELVPLEKEFGSFTVNMAVKQSTLKQRIETMKHHKMHQTSYKRSLLLLLTITMIVIAPIACSDLRGPETLSEEEVTSAELLFEKSTVEINGKEIFKSNNTQKVSGLDGLILAPANYGTFIISAIKFDGASLAGEIDGNKFTAIINEMDVVLTTESPILSDRTVDVWVRHFPNKKWDHNVLGTMPYARIHTPALLENLTPVSRPSPPTAKQTFDKEVFVVVEQMPQLEGGQAGIQSKVEYPTMAIRAGIEGRVTVQFIVDENGNVINPQIIRGIGGGCDEEALRVISQAKFTPGVQRGRNVAVQMSLPILFKLSDSDFKQSSEQLPPPPPPRKN